MQNFLCKLKSRKFLTCVAGIVMGVCMTFGLDESTINSVAGAIVALGSIVTYICTEGKIDAEAIDKIKDTADEVRDAVDMIEKIEG